MSVLQVRAVIKRKQPEKDLPEIWGDSLTEAKQGVINQTDTSTAPLSGDVFAASGHKGITVTTPGGDTYTVKPNSSNS